MEIYLDNSATTKIYEEVLDKMVETYKDNYGNPSSIHRMGLKIEKEILSARKSVARIINACKDEIYFTGSGTESNNIAILGAVNKSEKKYNIVTTIIEHSSVHNVYKELEDYLEVRYVNVDGNGNVDHDDLNSKIDENTILFSFILVNNEIGTIQNLDNVINIAKNKNKKIKIHIDAVQAFGKIKIDVKNIAVDTMSFSSHKIHGPKGVGGLYVKKGYKLKPIIFGGNQEKGLRSGTENTVGIIGFGKACDILYETFDKVRENFYNIRSEYIKKLIGEIDNIKINSLTNCAPHILSVSFRDVKGEVLVHFLENDGVFVSTGSACSSNAKIDHRVLSSINLDKEYIDGTIRISFGCFNNFDEIEYVVEKIKKAVYDIRRITKGI